jgi:hypothetical protein
MAVAKRAAPTDEASWLASNRFGGTPEQMRAFAKASGLGSTPWRASEIISQLQRGPAPGRPNYSSRGSAYTPAGVFTAEQIEQRSALGKELAGLPGIDLNTVTQRFFTKKEKSGLMKAASFLPYVAMAGLGGLAALPAAGGATATAGSALTAAPAASVLPSAAPFYAGSVTSAAPAASLLPAAAPFYAAGTAGAVGGSGALLGKTSSTGAKAGLTTSEAVLAGSAASSLLAPLIAPTPDTPEAAALEAAEVPREPIDVETREQTARRVAAAGRATRSENEADLLGAAPGAKRRGAARRRLIGY